MTDFPAEYDSPWKEGLEKYFEQFVEYCFPSIYAKINDGFGQPVISLVVLGDEGENWRPSFYEYNFEGFQIHFKFPIVKLLDYEENWDALEQSTNPFAVMIMAHLKTKSTKDDLEQRRQWKWTIVRRLYERGYNREDILELFRLIDWMMTLPEELQTAFEQQLERYQEENKMPLLSQIETRAMQRGTELGVQQGVQQEALRSGRKSVLRVLEVRFQEVPEAIADTINSIEDVDFLDRLLTQAVVIPSLEEFEKLLKSGQN